MIPSFPTFGLFRELFEANVACDFLKGRECKLVDEGFGLHAISLSGPGVEPGRRARCRSMRLEFAGSQFPDLSHFKNISHSSRVKFSDFEQPVE